MFRPAILLSMKAVRPVLAGDRLLLRKTVSNTSSKYQLSQFVKFSNVSHTEEHKMEEKKGGKLAQLWRRYGYLSVATYLSVYGLTLSSVFVCMEYDIFNVATFGYDAQSLVSSFCDKVETYTGFSALPGYLRENPTAGTFLLSWLLTKFTEPARLGLTIVLVPNISNFLYAKKKERQKAEHEHDEQNKSTLHSS